MKIKTANDQAEEESSKLNRPLETKRLNPEAILAGDKRPELEQNKVSALAHSFELQGRQLDPVVVTHSLQLLVGDYAVAACQLLGWPVNVILVPDGEGWKEQLTTVDSALLRCDLSALKRCELLLERKEIFLELNPSERHGGDRRSEAFRSSCKKEQLDSSFAADVALVRNRTKATVEGEARLAAKILLDVRERMRSTGIAQKKWLLKEISRLPSDQQMAYVERLLGNSLKEEKDRGAGGGGRAGSRAEGVGKPEDPVSLALKKLEAGLKEAGWQRAEERATVARALVSKANQSAKISRTLSALPAEEQEAELAEVNSQSVEESEAALTDSQEPTAAPTISLPLFDFLAQEESNDATDSRDKDREAA